MTDLTMQMEVNFFQKNSAEYWIPVTAKIPGSELALAKRGGLHLGFAAGVHVDHPRMRFIGMAGRDRKPRGGAD